MGSERGAPSDGGAPVVADHRVAVPGGRLFVREWRVVAEPRAPIVLLHDSLGCVELWRGFPEQLARRTGRTVIAYDRLGFGRSDPHPTRLATDFVATEGPVAVRAILEARGHDRWVGIGHSVGGGMALCAASGVDGCRATVAIAAQTVIEQQTLDGIRAARRSFAEPGGTERLARYHGEKTPWVLSAWIDTWLDPRFADWSLDDELTRITTPVLAIQGELDEFNSMAHAERIARLAPGPTDVVPMPGVGHVPYREAPDETLERVERFLGDLG